MSDSKSAPLTGHALLGGMALAILLIAGLFMWGSREERAFTDAARARSLEYHTLLVSEVRQSCSVAPPGERSSCIAKASAAAELRKRDNQREEADLVAQRKSALWTGIMAFTALLGLGLSAIGVALVWTTFRETKRAADEAKRSVDAFMASERARLSVDAFRRAQVDFANDVVAISVLVSNYGRSPCRVHSIHWFESATLPAAWDYDLLFQKVGGAVQAGATDERLTYLRTSFAANFVGGYVLYDTQFSKGCRSHFLWRLEHEDDQGYSDPAFIVFREDRLTLPADT